jgi:hypothetical protein
LLQDKVEIEVGFTDGVSQVRLIETDLRSDVCVGCTKQNKIYNVGGGWWDSREGSVMTAERVTIFGQPTYGRGRRW